MKKIILGLLLMAAVVFGQTTAQVLPSIPQQWFDNNGNPCNGCLLYSYVAGTTTPLDTWTTSAGSVANANPVVLDSTGRAAVWIKNVSYKFVLKNSTGATTYATYDNVQDSGKILQRDLADTTNDALNSALVGFKGTAPGASATTVRAELIRLNDIVIDVREYGAVCNGSTNDTTAIQAAIDALPEGATLNGWGLNCAVSTLTLKSNMGIQNFRLFAIASAVQFQSPITIDGSSSAKTNIVVRNVYVDGNRDNQTGMDSQPTEDGGRHCFRAIGDISNVLFDHVVGSYCATDGLELFSSGASTDAQASLKFQNIVVRDSLFTYNRRHGISADSLNNVTFINVTTTYNGVDIGVTEGGKGARIPVAVGTLYGRGFDIEGYGVGSGLYDVAFINCISLNNAAYALSFEDSAYGGLTDFYPRQRIRVIGGSYATGSAQVPGDLFAIRFVQTDAARYATTPELYQDVVMSGVWSNSIELLSTNNVSLIDPHVEQTGSYTVWLALSYAQYTYWSGARTTAGMTVFQDTTSANVGTPVLNMEGVAVASLSIGGVTAGAITANTTATSPALKMGTAGGASRTYDIGFAALQSTYPGAYSLGVAPTSSEGYLELRGGGVTTGGAGSNVNGVRLQRGTSTGTFETVAQFDDLATLPLGVKIGSDAASTEVTALMKTSTSCDPVNMADGAATYCTVALANCTVSDMPLVSFDQIGTTNIAVSATIRSSGVITATFVNNTGGAVDLPSGTLYAACIKF